MPSPTNTTITVDGTRLDVLYAQFTLSNYVAESDLEPSVGSSCTVFTAELNDQANLPFASLKKLFGLADHPNRDDVKDFTIELWKDESKQETLCTLAFKGWISGFTIASGFTTSGNHAPQLNVVIQSIVDSKNAPRLTK